MLPLKIWDFWSSEMHSDANLREGLCAILFHSKEWVGNYHSKYGSVIRVGISHIKLLLHIVYALQQVLGR